MDKQLLAALDNLSLGLEKLVEALQQKSDGKQSDTGAALQSGDFGNTLEQISVEIKSIKTDTQEILKNQQTIISLCKQKNDEKKTEPMEGGDPKKESQLKKGVATILLIAIAVLAIGMAFKLVGKVNILSVIALGIGILLVAFAFERVAKIKGATGGPMTIKEAAITSAIMIISSLAIMVSSWILSKIKPITIPQVLTAASIALLFTLVAPAMSKLIAAMTTTQDVEFRGMKMKTQNMSFGTVLKAAVMLPLLMVAMSIGIMMSSKFLAQITPISIPKALTAILIGVMFAIVARGIAGLITSLTTSQQAGGGGFGFKTTAIGMGKMFAIILGLPLIMFMIAKGIAWSSHALNQIKPIGFMQAITAILIAAMFAVVSLGIAKLINSLEKTNPVAILLLPVAMVAIALAIALSAAIFSKFKSSFDSLGYGTIFKILFLGASISIVAFLMAMATNKLGKLSIKEVLLLPLFLTTMSLALALSAYIFAKPMFKKSIDALGYGTIFRILLLGFAMGVVVFIVAFASKFLGQLSLKQVILLPVLFTLMSLALAVSALIFATFKSSFDKISFGMILKLLVYGIVTAIIFVAYAFATKIIGKMLKPMDALKGGLVIIILAGVIAVSSLILGIGQYKNYPSLKWAIGVAASLAAFGIGALLLGSAVFGPQALIFLAGLAAILVVSATILATAAILGAGNYKKYPTLKWTIGVVAALGAFALGAILLGINVINPLFWMGLPMLLTVANTIVEVAQILSAGKYDANFGQWAAGVALLYGTFTPIILILGAVGLAAAISSFFGGPDPFETGRGMLASIAWSIVEVSLILGKGKYTGGPTEAWAKGVSIAIGAFAPVYQMLVNAAIFEAFGSSGVGPDEFAGAIVTVSKGITTAALYFAKNKSAFKNGPPEEWAKGVGLAIGAFAPVFKVMEDFPFTGGQKIARAMRHVAHAIVNVAEVLSKGAALYKEGQYPSKQWGQGVGESLKAFNPVFDYMFENSSWWGDSDTEVIDNMKYGMVQIAWGIYDVGQAISGGKYDTFPTKQWGQGIKTGIQSFLEIFNMIWDSGLSTYMFRDLSSRVADGAASMAMTAAVLYSNRKAFTVRLDPGFIKNISKNIIGFAKLALQLDKMLVSEKTVTTTSSGIFGFGGSSTTRKVKERKDLSLPKDVAIQLVTVAGILHRNKKLFSFKLNPEWVSSLSKSLLGYVTLQKRLEEMTGGGLKAGLLMGLTALNPLAGLAFAGASALLESRTDDVVAKTTKRLIKIANLLYANRKAFEVKIDPFFMRKVGQNLLDFTYVVKKIGEIEGRGTTFFGRIGSAFEAAMGNDPISRTTRRMITLAKGYDAMANALIKLGRALEMLKLKNLSELGTLTKQLSSGNYDPDKRVSPVKTKELYTVRDDKKKKLSGDLERKNEILYVSQKMDEVVKLLAAIRKNTNSIDGFVNSQASKPKEPLEIKVDVKTKK